MAKAHVSIRVQFSGSNDQVAEIEAIAQALIERTGAPGGVSVEFDSEPEAAPPAAEEAGSGESADVP